MAKRSQIFFNSYLCSWDLLLRHLDPAIVEDPDRAAVHEAAQVIERSDAPILAAARAARVDYLVTWNTRDFQTDSVRRWAPFPLVTPGEFLRAFRDALPKDF